MTEGVHAPTDRPGVGRTMLGLGDHPVLFYDARCGVCRRFIRMAVHADHKGLLRIAPLQGARGERLREAFPQFARRESAVWIGNDGPPSGFSDAILATLDYLGGRWRLLARLGRVIPRSLRDWAYRVFARSRPHMGRFGLAELDEVSRSRLLPEAAPDADDTEIRTVRLEGRAFNLAGP
jgi:predicted DCC family thiol-disulfide oxidoreductase YuxK